MSWRIPEAKRDKFSAAFILAWSDLIKKEFTIGVEEGDFSVSEIMDNLRLRVKNSAVDLSLDDYRNFFMWYTTQTNYIDPDQFIPGLTSEVARRAGFEEFCDLKLRTGYHSSSGHIYYTETILQGLKESFLANRSRWIDAFITVNKENDTLPPITEFTIHSSPFEQNTIDLVAPLLINRNIEDAIRFLFPVTEEGLEVFAQREIPFDLETTKRNAQFMEMVEDNFRASLRVIQSRERSYTAFFEFEEEGDGPPFKIKVVKQDEGKWWSIVPFLLLEAGCTVDFIEYLVEEGFFDL